jgi:hypothetical protein
MTAVSFLVGVAILWFSGFMYVIHGLHRGEGSILGSWTAGPPGRRPHAADGSHPGLGYATTRVKRGPSTPGDI